MKCCQQMLSSRMIMLVVCVFCVCSTASFAATIPASTAIPIRFTHTIDSARAKPGDLVTAQTIQAVVLPDGVNIARGAQLIGHVVEAHPYVFDPAPYVKQTPSVLTIHFDRIVDRGASIPLCVSVRALADPITSDQANSPTREFEGDSPGTMILIGGDQFTPGSRTVFSPDRDVVGYVRKQGVFAHLVPNEDVRNGVLLNCQGTDTEQSVAIFSASACGVFGYDSITLTKNGSGSDGTFRLESRHDTVKIYAKSAALVQVL